MVLILILTLILILILILILTLILIIFFHTFKQSGQCLNANAWTNTDTDTPKTHTTKVPILADHHYAHACDHVGYWWRDRQKDRQINQQVVRRGGLPWRSALWWYTQGFVSQSSLAQCRTQRWDPHPRSSGRCPGCQAQTTTPNKACPLNIITLILYVMIYLSHWRATGNDVSIGSEYFLY